MHLDDYFRESWESFSLEVGGHRLSRRVNRSIVGRAVITLGLLVIPAEIGEFLCAAEPDAQSYQTKTHLSLPEEDGWVDGWMDEGSEGIKGSERWRSDAEALKISCRRIFVK